MKKFITRLEKNEYVRSVALTALIIGALITIGSFARNTFLYFYDNVFITNNIADQISKLSPGQDIEYFKKYLGPQILQREVSSLYTEYIFNYKGAFIQALVRRKDDSVIYWAITHCGKDPVVLRRPVFLMPAHFIGEDSSGELKFKNSLSPKLLLNKSTFTDFLMGEKGDIHVFISGATANSFAFESIYFGNPSAYLTIIIGVNSICDSSIDLDGYMDADTERSVPPSQEALEKLRESVKVNTYAETAPFAGEEVIDLLNAVHSGEHEDPYLDFGVDRIRVRYFAK